MANNLLSVLFRLQAERHAEQSFHGGGNARGNIVLLKLLATTIGQLTWDPDHQLRPIGRMGSEERRAHAGKPEGTDGGGERLRGLRQVL